MKLKSSNKIVVFLLLFALSKPLSAEDQIDIWSKPKKNEIIIKADEDKNETTKKVISSTIQENKIIEEIKIENKVLKETEDEKLFGIYEPSDSGFNLDMWSRKVQVSTMLGIVGLAILLPTAHCAYLCVISPCLYTTVLCR